MRLSVFHDQHYAPAGGDVHFDWEVPGHTYQVQTSHTGSKYSTFDKAVRAETENVQCMDSVENGDPVVRRYRKELLEALKTLDRNETESTYPELAGTHDFMAFVEQSIADYPGELSEQDAQLWRDSSLLQRVNMIVDRSLSASEPHEADARSGYVNLLKIAFKELPVGEAIRKYPELTDVYNIILKAPHTAIYQASNIPSHQVGVLQDALATRCIEMLATADRE